MGSKKLSVDSTESTLDKHRLKLNVDIREVRTTHDQFLNRQEKIETLRSIWNR